MLLCATLQFCCSLLYFIIVVVATIRNLFLFFIEYMICSFTACIIVTGFCLPQTVYTILHTTYAYCIKRNGTESFEYAQSSFVHIWRIRRKWKINKNAQYHRTIIIEQKNWCKINNFKLVLGADYVALSIIVMLWVHINEQENSFRRHSTPNNNIIDLCCVHFALFIQKT